MRKKRDERPPYLQTNGGLLLLKVHQKVLEEPLFLSLVHSRHLRILERGEKLPNSGPRHPGYKVLDTRACTETDIEAVIQRLEELRTPPDDLPIVL